MRAGTHALGSLLARLQRGRAGAVGARVLAYHAVGTELPFPHYGISIDPSQFTGQMKHVAESRSNAPLSAASNGLSGAVAITFDDGYRDALLVAAPVLKSHGLAATVFVTVDFARAAGIYLSPAELRELEAYGIAVGSHGITHRRLTTCTDAELREELRGSRERLEEWTGRSVTALAYPHGAVDRRVRDAAAEAGYTIGCTSRFGANGPTRDPLLLCRIEIVSADQQHHFQQKLRGQWDWYGRRHRDPAR